ncbi:hypothetical protein O1611_g7154 [Lasiodiplodia mahajangana]|uniref:Uncharacterized protein n=1 Tax=Lasiodiplodia mahajangana TaxID=1108764 RepID=A0ACC2JG35_9PEZI|nr:hypothetical protein O1611_g7154 [Lasiodiplodia mahajangana]
MRRGHSCHHAWGLYREAAGSTISGPEGPNKEGILVVGRLVAREKVLGAFAQQQESTAYVELRGSGRMAAGHGLAIDEYKAVEDSSY